MVLTGIRVPFGKSIGVYAGLALLFLMVVFPMTLHLLYVKAALFAFLIFLAACSWAIRLRVSLHPQVLVWVVAIVAIGMFFSFTGVLASTPGALKQLQVYAFWPLVYGVVLAGITDERVIAKIHGTLVISTIGISLYGLVLVSTAMGELPNFRILEWLSFEEEEGGGMRDGFFAIRYQGLNSLPFLVPYLVASLASSHGTRSDYVSRKWLWIALALSLLVVVISGRRGLQIVAALTPLIVIWLARHQPHQQRLSTRVRMTSVLLTCTAVVFVFFIYLGSSYNVSFADLVAEFKTGFQVSAPETESAFFRREQWYALISGWEQNVLLGNGHGASAAGSIRSPELPWAYELYYVALLFQVGLLGLGAYALAVAWIYYKGAAIIRSADPLAVFMFTSLAGMTGMLIASATNPYLARFDGWWTIFLPLSIINCWLLRHQPFSNLTRPTASGIAASKVRRR